MNDIKIFSGAACSFSFTTRDWPSRTFFIAIWIILAMIKAKSKMKKIKSRYTTSAARKGSEVQYTP